MTVKDAFTDQELKSLAPSVPLLVYSDGVNDPKKINIAQANVPLSPGDVIYLPDDTFFMSGPGFNRALPYWSTIQNLATLFQRQVGNLTCNDIYTLLPGPEQEISDLNNGVMLQMTPGQEPVAPKYFDLSKAKAQPTNEAANPILQPGSVVYFGRKDKGVQGIRMVGKVTNPFIPMGQNNTIALPEALSKAGCLNDQADMHNLIIMRQLINAKDNPAPVSMEVIDYKNLEADKVADQIILHPNDVVCVPPAPDNFVMLGDLSFSGAYSFSRLSNMPIAKSNNELTIERMLGFAGAIGIETDANIVVMQQLLTNPTAANIAQYSLKDDIKAHTKAAERRLVSRGDVIWYSQSDTFTIVGETNVQGTYTIEKKLADVNKIRSLSQLGSKPSLQVGDILDNIEKFQGANPNILLLKPGTSGQASKIQVLKQADLLINSSKDLAKNPNIEPGDIIVVQPQAKQDNNALLTWVFTRAIPLNKIPPLFRTLANTVISGVVPAVK